MNKRLLITWALAASVAWTAAPGLRAQAPEGTEPAEAAQEAPDPVRFEQRLGESIPLDLAFRDAEGRMVKLGDYFGEKPIVLSLVYYECPMLCTLVLNGMVTGFKEIPYTIGEDFEVVTISFDPEETHVLAKAKKDAYLELYGRPAAGDGWHFLVGEKDQVDAICDAVGFGYQLDPKSGEFAHRSGIYILTPEGKISHVYPGIEYAARDLRLGLVEASDRKIGNVVDRLALLCFHYDPNEGAYSLVVMNVIRAGGFLTVAVIAATLLVFLRRERRHAAEARAS